MNARPGAGESRFRRTSISTDDGQSWSPFVEDTELPDPITHGSIIRFTESPPRLLFSNPASQTNRENLTVRLSYDEGQTWTSGRTIEPGPSGYSDLVIQQDNDIGLIYEDINAQFTTVTSIDYAQFNLAWLTDGADSLTQKTSEKLVIGLRFKFLILPPKIGGRLAEGGESNGLSLFLNKKYFEIDLEVCKKR